MMALWAVVLVLITLGVDLIEQNIAGRYTPSPSATRTQDAGGALLIYRQAVENYVLSNSSIGASAAATIPGNSLTFPTGTSMSILPASLGNLIVPDGNGGRTVYTWVSAPAGTAGVLVAQLGGDATIGTVNSSGTAWVSPEYGTMPAFASSGPPAGDLISVVTLGN